METKKEIREECLVRRAEISKELQTEYSIRITADTINHPFFIDADYILMYADFNNEVQTEEIAKKAYNDGKKVFYPKVFGDTMDYYLIHNIYELNFGYRGIREPNPSNYEFIHELKSVNDNHKNVLMIMPGVAYDSKRNRVGYGKGFFDKYLFYLASKLQGDERVKYNTIALAYSCQLVNEIPIEETDIKPDILITESHIYK